MATTAERVARHRARKKSAATELLFVRHDWQLFLHPERLPQKAGCAAHLLRAVALKELADNALDQGGTGCAAVGASQRAAPCSPAWGAHRCPGHASICAPRNPLDRAAIHASAS